MSPHEWEVVTNGKYYRVCNKVTGKFLEEAKHIPFVCASYLAPRQWSTYEEAAAEAAKRTWRPV